MQRLTFSLAGIVVLLAAAALAYTVWLGLASTLAPPTHHVTQPIATEATKPPG